MTFEETRTAYIGLGSNLRSPAGTPAETIREALRSLEEIGEVTARSSLYETTPIGITDQPVFVNAVAALRSADSPDVLLEKLLSIECSFGRDRRRTTPKGPRTLDLDLLLVDGLIVNTPKLSLPHPALVERRFVLAPLAEIAPQLQHPVLHATIHDLLIALHDADANRLEDVRILHPRP